MKKIICIILLIAFLSLVIVSCATYSSRAYVNKVIDAIEAEDDETFFELLKDKRYNINANPNSPVDMLFYYYYTCDTPLEKACRVERYDYVEALINRGADVNLAYNTGALDIAASYMDTENGKKNSVAIVKILLENGADPDGKGSWSVLHFIAFNPDWENAYEITKLLIQYGASTEAREDAYELAKNHGATQEYLDLLKP